MKQRTVSPVDGSVYVERELAPDAAIDQGSVRVFGWTRNGPIRALP